MLPGRMNIDNDIYNNMNGDYDDNDTDYIHNVVKQIQFWQ